jgi:hypothetical protein
MSLGSSKIRGWGGYLKEKRKDRRPGQYDTDTTLLGLCK